MIPTPGRSIKRKNPPGTSATASPRPIRRRIRRAALLGACRRPEEADDELVPIEWRDREKVQEPEGDVEQRKQQQAHLQEPGSGR